MNTIKIVSEGQGFSNTEVEIYVNGNLYTDGVLQDMGQELLKLKDLLDMLNGIVVDTTEDKSGVYNLYFIEE